MDLVRLIRKLTEISFDVFQNQEEYVIVDKDGKEIESINIDHGSKKIKIR